MLLDLHLSGEYPGRPGVLDGLELAIRPGEIVGLVGESGSGKSTVAAAILRLLEWKGGSARGEIRFRGRDLMGLTERQMRAIRGKEIAMVLQSPLSALNPALRVGSQLLECWRAHRENRKQPQPDLLALLDSVNLPADQSFLERYPSQISIGQAQRVLIAMAILHHPSLLIADEPTSALDPVTQSEILALLRSLNQRMGMGVLYISHDLLSVASFCHRIDILQGGRIIESNTPAGLFLNPQRPYTRKLLNAIPQLPEDCLTKCQRYPEAV